MKNKARKYSISLTRAIRYRGFAFPVCLFFAAALQFGTSTFVRAEPELLSSPSSTLTTEETGSAATSIEGAGSVAEDSVAGSASQEELLSSPVMTGPTRTDVPDAITSGQTYTSDHAPVRSSPTVTGDSLLSNQTGTASDLQEQQTFVDIIHARVSYGIKATANWMDSFFGDERYESELNESYVRFQYNLFKEKGAHLVHPRPDVRIRIILPQLRRNTRLVFSGTPKERTDFSAIGTEPDNALPEGEKEADVTAGVQQTLLDTVKRNLSIRVGLRLHNRKPLVVFGPRYRLLFPYTFWQYRFIEEVNWTNQTGWDSTTTFDAERQLPHNLLFRASNTWSWNEDMEGLLYAVSFGVGQPIDESRALGYEWVNSFLTQPINELTEVALRVRYRQQLWRRRWIYFELSPQYRFPRSNSFRGIAGIAFKLEMILGNYR